jgi:hypothetical protein
LILLLRRAAELPEEAQSIEKLEEKYRSVHHADEGERAARLLYVEVVREVPEAAKPRTIKPDLDSRTGFRHREWQKWWRLIKPGQKCGAKL